MLVGEIFVLFKRKIYLIQGDKINHRQFHSQPVILDVTNVLDIFPIHFGVLFVLAIFFVRFFIWPHLPACPQRQQEVIDGIFDPFLGWTRAVGFHESPLQEVAEPFFGVSCGDSPDTVCPASEILLEKVVFGAGLFLQAIDFFIQEIILKNFALTVFFAIPPLALVRPGNAVDNGVDNLVGGDVRQVPRNVGELPHIIVI